MTSQNTNLEIHGIVASPNPFGSSPGGSLAVADNTVIRNAGIIESRRGFNQHSLLAGGQRGTSFQSHLMAIAGSTLYYYDSSWTALAGSFSPPDGAPIRFLEANRELLFTTSRGIYSTPAFNTAPLAAGLPPAFPPFSQSDTGLGNLRLYRIVYGYRDVRGNLVLSEPSAPYYMSFNTVVPAMDVYFPAELTNYPGAFVRVYRSLTTTPPAQPLDETFLAAQLSVADADLTNGFFFADTTPDAQLGVALYTNITQEGVGQSNARPPIAKDLCAFKNYVIYANTIDFQRLFLNLADIDGVSGLLPEDQITIDGVTYTASLTGETVSAREFLVPTIATAPGLSTAQRIMAAASSLLRCIQFHNGTVLGYSIDPVVGATQDIPALSDINDTIDPAATGRMQLQAATLGQPVFSVSFGAIAEPVTSITRIGGSLVTVVQPGYPFTTVGQQVQLTGSDPLFPSGVKTIFSLPNPSTWTYSEAGPSGFVIGGYTAAHANTAQAWRTPDGLSSLDSADPSGIRISKVNQPGAAPLEDGETVGIVGQAIQRVIPLQESVLIWKTDGLYRLTGNTTADFSIQPYDLTVQLPSPESARALSNVVVAWTNKGVWAYSESSGGQSLSRAIDDALFEIRASQPALAVDAFALAYESEQMYLLWLPGVDNGGNTGFPYTLPIMFGDSVLPGAQAVVFNARTNAWTRWTPDAVDAFMDPVTDTIVLLNGGEVLQERKSSTDEDYQDVGGTATITAVIDDTHITMAGPGVGDLVIQGSVSARVAEASGSDLTLVSPGGAFTVASATYARAIDCNVTWLPEAGENPGTAKNFQEHSLNFRHASFDFIDAHYTTDVSQTEETKRRYGDPDSDSNVNTRTLMPNNKARGVMLNAGFRHQQAKCNFQLQGSSIKYRETSTRTPSHKK